MMLQSSTIRQRKAPPPSIYDPAGNILSKTVAGKTTTYIYDKANQLVSSKTADGKVTKYEYDAAGRMTKEGEKTFAYGWLDKVMQVAENGKTSQTYSYDISGQLATADYGAGKETFLWDGLALLSRNNLKYVNEPAVTGGNPILAGDKMLFDDLLGNTLGVKDGEKFSAIDRDAFGELKPGEKPNLAVNFFTGKPEIDGLGYSFLFRNYRADLGKWQTTAPLGYPDGWNNLAYVNNGVLADVDPLGLITVGDSFISDDIRYTLTGIVYHKTYGIVATMTSTQYEWDGAFDVYRIEYSWECVKSDCQSSSKSGTTSGNAYMAASVYRAGGQGGGLLVFRDGLSNVNNLPSSPTGYYVPLSQQSGAPPAPSSTSIAPKPSTHVHE